MPGVDPVMIGIPPRPTLRGNQGDVAMLHERDNRSLDGSSVHPTFPSKGGNRWVAFARPIVCPVSQSDEHNLLGDCAAGWALRLPCEVQ